MIKYLFPILVILIVICGSVHASEEKPTTLEQALKLADSCMKGDIEPGEIKLCLLALNVKYQSLQYKNALIEFSLLYNSI